MATLWAGLVYVRFSKGVEISPFPVHPERLWGLAFLLFGKSRKLFPRGKAVEAGR
jgi:hypothetical protein